MSASEIPTKVKNKALVTKRREQIVLAAIELFARKGFHETNLRELAEKAGISHGNIYDYVGTKQDIFYLVHEFINNMATEKMIRSTENIDDPLERLRRLVRSEFDLMYEWSDAILLIIQETHILDKPQLKTLLTTEKARVSRIEAVLQECMEKGLIRPFNTRIASNVIKSMTETWVSKRWDLREHVDRMEMEKAIIDLMSNGLLTENAAQQPFETAEFQGKSALVVNAGTVLGRSICTSLLARGVRLAVHVRDGSTKEEKVGGPNIPEWERATFYREKDYGQISPGLFDRIVADFGPIDMLIHDLSIDRENEDQKEERELETVSTLQENFRDAQNLAAYFRKTMSRTMPGRIVYIAPWAWDEVSDPLPYHSVKASIMELTKTMAKIMAPESINVNCVVPGFIRDVKPSKTGALGSAEMANEVPLGVLGEIVDVFESVCFLVSDKSKYITGQVLRVTGGLE